MSDSNSQEDTCLFQTVCNFSENPPGVEINIKKNSSNDHEIDSLFYVVDRICFAVSNQKNICVWHDHITYCDGWGFKFYQILSFFGAAKKMKKKNQRPKFTIWPLKSPFSGRWQQLLLSSSPADLEAFDASGRWERRWPQWKMKVCYVYAFYTYVHAYNILYITLYMYI